MDDFSKTEKILQIIIKENSIFLEQQNLNICISYYKCQIICVKTYLSVLVVTYYLFTIICSIGFRMET